MDVMTTRQIFQRLATEFLVPHKKRILCAVCCMFVVGITNALNVWLIKPAIDKIFVQHDEFMLIVLPLGIVVVSLIKGAADYGQDYLMKYVGQRLVSDMQLRLFQHVIHSDLKQFSKESSGKVISRFTNDILVLRGAIANIITSIANRSLTIVFLIGLMFYHSATLSLITFAVFPLTILPVMIMSRRMRQISAQQQENMGHFTGQLDETFQAIKVVKSYLTEDLEIKKAKTIIEQLFELYVKAARVSASASPTIEALSGIGIGLVIWYGGLQVIAGNMTAGSIFSFITSFVAAYRPMKALVAMNNSFQEGLVAARRLFNLLDQPIERALKASSQSLEVTQGNIELINIDFSYGKKMVLEGLSMKIPATKQIAIVGESGGGKSTIINLIMRFYDIKGGQILIDNQDINNCTLDSLRQNISLVSQDIMLFDSTIYDNIAYGSKDVTYEDVIKAAKLAGADQFIEKLSKKYETSIGQNGQKLSGGQRQRLSLARAFLKRSKILLLDEATSALDPLSETHLQNSLKLLSDRTIIMITHRLNLVVNADIIYVIKGGKLSEKGTHQELLAKRGYYFELYTENNNELTQGDQS